MSTQKKLILMSGLLVLSFAISCGVSMLLGPAPPPPPLAKPAPVAATRPGAETLPPVPMVAEAQELSPKEQKLEQFIRELRARLAECRRTQRKLDEQTKRVQMAQGLLKKDAQDLEQLRFELVVPLTRLKEARAELEKTRILITREERTNLKKTALIYEKMDATSGSEIFKEMCSNKQDDDAAKILRYMSDRSAAKILAALTDKALAARLSEKLKRMREQG